MNFIKQRKIKRLRKKAGIQAREREIRVLKSQGLTLKEISEKLNLKESSVRRVLKKHKLI